MPDPSAHSALPRMTDAESLMWRLEKDPMLSSNVSTVTLLDRVPDFDRLVRRMDRATASVVRLRQKVAPAIGPTAPAWVDDRDFDVRHHVRRTALPQPATDRDVFDLASAITSAPFDRNRPLWELVVIEGLPGGRAAFVTKFHHTLMDGEGGVRVSLQFLDFERHPDEPPADDHTATPASPASHEREPNLGDLVVDFTRSSLRVPLTLAKELTGLVLDPRKAPAAAVATYDAVRAVSKVLGETGKARSPLWHERSVNRRLEVLRVPFDPTRRVAKDLGGTLNTAFLTCAAHAAGAYHRAKGIDVDELRTTMAISTRDASTTANNAFSLARLLVPTGPMSVTERFLQIDELTRAAKADKLSASLDLLAGVAATLPTSVITRIARQQTQTVDFGTSNVRGSPVPLYIAGAKILANHPIGPTAGTAFNLTLLSYHGSLDMGLNVDTAAVDEPELLRSLLEQAFAELVT